MFDHEPIRVFHQQRIRTRDHHQPIRSLPQFQTLFSDNEACVDWEFANKEIKEQYGIDLKYEKEVMQRKLIEGLLSTFSPPIDLI